MALTEIPTLTTAALECLEAIFWLERSEDDSDEFEVAVRVQQLKGWDDERTQKAHDGYIRPALEELVRRGVVEEFVYGNATSLKGYAIEDEELVLTILRECRGLDLSAGAQRPRRRLSALAS